MKIVAVVIPCRNEAGTIGRLVSAARLGGRVQHVFVANDSSTDATAANACLAAEVLDVPKERPGLAGVYRFGLMQALARCDADWIFELDAGGSHDPRELPRFFQALEEGYDLVFGERVTGRARYAAPWQRRLLSGVGTAATNLLHGTSFADATSGYIGYTRAALQVTHGQLFQAQGHYYQTEVRLRAHRAGLSYCEVPITFKSSKSSLRWGAVVEAARLVLG